MRNAVIILGALVLAMLVGAATLSQVVAGRSPALAAMAFPPNGFARAALAGRIAGASLAQQLADRRSALSAQVLRDVTIPAEAVTLARAAYRSEPVAIDALRVLALDGLSREQDARTLALLEGARQLSRRSTGISMLLLDRYVQTGRDRESMAVLDELLRRQSGAHGDLLVGLAANVGRDELLPHYRRLLAPRPPWADQFWRQLAQSPTGIANAAPLRFAYAEKGGKVDPEVDALLVSALADNGRFDDAARIAALLGVTAARSGQLVTNGDFRTVPEVPVFDWMIASSGDYGAEVDPERHQLVMSAISGARGEVARQLVRLPAAPLVLRVKAGSDTSADSLRRILVELVCPTDDYGTLLSQPLSTRPLVVDPRGCRWAWLRLRVAIPEEGEGIDAALDQISLSARR